MKVVKLPKCENTDFSEGIIVLKFAEIAKDHGNLMTDVKAPYRFQTRKVKEKMMTFRFQRKY